MDSITHGISGAIAAMAFAPPEWQAPATAALTISALYPDIDLLYLVKGRKAFFTNHRGWTHSITSAAIFAPALAGALYWTFPETGFVALMALSFIGVLLHIALDLITIWGAEFFWPFTRKKYSWNLIPSGNLLFVGSLFFSFLGAIFYPEHRSLIASSGIVACLALVVIAYYSKGMARKHCEKLLVDHELEATIKGVFPARQVPGAWLVVAEDDSNFYSYHLSIWKDTTAAVVHTIEKAPDNRFTAAAHALEEAATFRNVVIFPVVSYEELEDTHRVIYTSLRDELHMLKKGLDRTRIRRGFVVNFSADSTILSKTIIGSTRNI